MKTQRSVIDVAKLETLLDMEDDFIAPAKEIFIIANALGQLIAAIADTGLIGVNSKTFVDRFELEKE